VILKEIIAIENSIPKNGIAWYKYKSSWFSCMSPAKEKETIKVSIKYLICLKLFIIMLVIYI